MPLVTLDLAAPIATLWLDRADKRNALSRQVMDDLAAALDRVRDDAAIRVVVLRGRGPVFSSGIDHALLLEVMQQAASVPFGHLHHDLQDVVHRLERMRKPVVAVLHGLCVGMALELALACDLRLALDGTVLGLPEIAFGIVPDVGGTTRLVREIGVARARELVLTGRMVKAARAAELGLVHEVARDEADLERRVARACEQLATHPPTAVGMAKELVRAVDHGGEALGFRLEGVFQQLLMAQPDLAAQFPRALAFIKARIADAE